MNNAPNLPINGSQLPLPPGFSRDVAPRQGLASLPEATPAQVPTQASEAEFGVGSLRQFAARKAAGYQNPSYGELAASREAHLGRPLGSYSTGLTEGLHSTGSAGATRTTEYASGGLHDTFLGTQQRATQQAQRNQHQI